MNQSETNECVFVTAAAAATTFADFEQPTLWTMEIGTNYCSFSLKKNKPQLCFLRSFRLNALRLLLWTTTLVCIC